MVGCCTTASTPLYRRNAAMPCEARPSASGTPSPRRNLCLPAPKSPETGIQPKVRQYPQFPRVHIHPAFRGMILRRRPMNAVVPFLFLTGHKLGGFPPKSGNASDRLSSTVDCCFPTIATTTSTACTRGASSRRCGRFSAQRVRCRSCRTVTRSIAASSRSKMGRLRHRTSSMAGETRSCTTTFGPSSTRAGLLIYSNKDTAGRAMRRKSDYSERQHQFGATS